MKLIDFFKKRSSRILLFSIILFSLTFLLSTDLYYFIASDFDFNYLLPEGSRNASYLFVGIVVLVEIYFLYLFGFFRAISEYYRLRNLLKETFAMFISFVLLFVLATIQFSLFAQISRRVLLVNFVFSVIVIVTLRICFSYKHLLKFRGVKKERLVAIYGAGSAGVLLAEMLKNTAPDVDVVVFIDDNEKKSGVEILGIPVVPMPDNIKELRSRYVFNEVIFAIPSLPDSFRHELIQKMFDAGLKVSRVPDLNSLENGEKQINQLRQIEIEDLLSREETHLDSKAIQELICGRVVLVTGAGGSIGSELCRQIASFAPHCLVLVERCEVQLYSISQDLKEKHLDSVAIELIGDVTDEERMEMIFRKYRPSVVFHAAAHKHVPIMEYQPSEAIKNNALGTANVLRISSKYNVNSVVVISTDKAINPTNAMGASKRLSEIILQSMYLNPENKTRFMAVRFGNVLGSSGSVIPLFKKQLKEGGPLTVTHKDIVRYFMTIPEAVGLVLQTAVIGKGGSIYVLDMGAPVKIYDLAKQIITLSGLKPFVDINIEITGLRPGEKLFEEIKTVGENFEESGHPRISRFVSKPMPYEELAPFLEKLQSLTVMTDRNKIKLEIKELIPEYIPYLN